MSNSPAPTTLGLLLIEGFSLMSYASMVEPFRAANVLSGRTLYRWRHIALEGASARASNGAAIACEACVGEPFDGGTLFVFAAGDPATFHSRATLSWLRRLARRNVSLAGVSGGPFVLAKAGVLDGHAATIHWEHEIAFAAAFPQVQLEKGLYVIDRRRMTCAGGTAALDLALELIEREHGHALASRVGEWFIRTEHRAADQAQRLSLRERYGLSDDRVLKVLAHMEASLEEPVSSAALAAFAGVSVRQLERLFRRALGQGVKETDRRLRLARARELLTKTSASVMEVSLACGFQSRSHFSNAFKRAFGRAPTAERLPRP